MRKYQTERWSSFDWLFWILSLVFWIGLASGSGFSLYRYVTLDEACVTTQLPNPKTSILPLPKNAKLEFDVLHEWPEWEQYGPHKERFIFSVPIGNWLTIAQQTGAEPHVRVGYCPVQRDCAWAEYWLIANTGVFTAYEQEPISWTPAFLGLETCVGIDHLALVDDKLTIFPGFNAGMKKGSLNGLNGFLVIFFTVSISFLRHCVSKAAPWHRVKETEDV